MKFSFEWLKKIVSFQETPEKIAELLTLYLAETTIIRQGKRVVLDVDLLPNRISDAASHLGLAREISALLGKKFSYPNLRLKESKTSINNLLQVKIQSQHCRRYVSRVIRQVKVQASPLWLQERLKDCGLRPINNIVDSTNYIMLLTGQPLHAFDFDKVASYSNGKKEIIIREAQKGEKITTLEDKTYTLEPSHLLISDREKPLALAGIKGGKAAEIDANTANIILESANFSGPSIRLTSRSLGLRTDASWRFEHNLDLELAPYAIDLLAQLILDLAGGEVAKGMIDIKKVASKKVVIPLSFQTIDKILGWQIKKSEVLKFLKLLDFSFEERKDYLLISPPRFRNDIEVAEDVVGEIARLYGFEKVPSLPLKESLIFPQKNEFWEFKEKIKDWLKGAHLEEVYNYSLISKQDKEILSSEWQKKMIALANPLSDLFAFLRPTCLFNFLKNVSDNFRFVDEVRLFEIGKIYFLSKNKPQEETVFSGILASKNKNLKGALFFEAKGILENIFTDLGLDADDYTLEPLQQTEYSSLLSLGIAIFQGKELIGVVGVPLDKLLKKYDLHGEEIVFWEVKLLPLMKLSNKEREFEPLPQYPAVIRDISFLIRKDIFIDSILKTIQNVTSFLEDVDLFDIYEGNNLPREKQSLSFHLIFRSPNKTLTTEEVDEEMQKIYQALRQLGAEIR